jgi:hypothetical protein
MKRLTLALLAALILPGLATAQDTAPVAGPAAPQIDTGANAPAPLPDQPITYFAGTFDGPTRVVDGAGAGTTADERQSRVIITPKGNGGFELQWSTLFVDNENTGVMKVKDSTTIDFDQAAAGVYTGTEQNALFSGKPIYWARINGNTLFVQALIVQEDGTYDLTHYARTVEGDTMRLEFSRFKDGDEARRVQGDLVRTAN